MYILFNCADNVNNVLYNITLKICRDFKRLEEKVGCTTELVETNYVHFKCLFLQFVQFLICKEVIGESFFNEFYKPYSSSYRVYYEQSVNIAMI